MRELTTINRKKKTYKLEKDEFHKGEWLKLVPKGDLVELQYIASNRILIVKDCIVEDIKEGQK